MGHRLGVVVSSRWRCRLFSQQKLFTPGPLTTSATTKAAMMRDVGSRDKNFVATIRFVRDRIVELARLPSSVYTCVPVQGSGTYALESVLTTGLPRSREECHVTMPRVLVLANGAYGARAAAICDVLNYDVTFYNGPEDERLDLKKIEALLAENSKKKFDMVTSVHCETTSGIVNNITEIGNLIRKYSPASLYLVDAMSSFGAIPTDFSNTDFVVSSSNKCLEGVPGFSFVIANVEKLSTCRGQARSVSLDLYAQYEGLERTGQFRFTPPTHAFLALKQALLELEAEGGVEARMTRYRRNCEILREGMQRMGFVEFLDASHRDAYIITSYLYPKHPRFQFDIFYDELCKLGIVLYPGKVTKANCFRVGNIGQLFEEDMRNMLNAVEAVCGKLGLPLPLNGGLH
ncbi:2-aminoethylphosphonate--pyruvate transaminase-like [Oscarella lobularis]|uniref:2-aminoethylphosphonate--pyruvate transaminase-like n=1 Tax=Oscarella lobularis TaxID=121494 RepID=UPI0033138442